MSTGPSLGFADFAWEACELIVRSGKTKSRRERRIPIDQGLWDILVRQREGRQARRPGTAQSPKIAERVRARFTREHVFVSTQNTPLDGQSRLWRAFLRCCRLARIETRTVDAEGRLVEHVDVHSLRRTFITNLIVSGADPETVRQLAGHKTLAMTMKVYTKIRAQTKRQALAKLTYGQGVVAPEHAVDYPGEGGLSVQNGHHLVTGKRQAAAS